MSERLPRDEVSDGSCIFRCPRCGCDVGRVKVSLEDLFDAHVVGELEFATRSALGAPADDGLVADCEACKRPFLIALQGNRKDGREVRLLAARTKADLKFLTGECAW